MGLLTSVRLEAPARDGFEVRRITEAELELERGCLVYSFDVHAAGHKGVTEIVVDAGTGKVLSRMDESKAQEAAEKAAEKNESG